VDVDLKVSDTLPLHVSVDFTNDHNQYTAPLRVGATISYDDLWQLGHSATFTYLVAPQDPNNSQIFAGSYLAPVINSPFSILVFGYDSNSNVATIGGTDVLGKGYAIGVRAVDQLPNLGKLSQSFNFGFDYKDISQNIGIGSETTAAPVAYWPLDISYTLQSSGSHSTTKATLSATAGIRGLGSDTYDFEYVRASARPNFAHINLDFTQTESLWDGIVASQHFTGQAADGPLVSSEQFAAGGLTSVRGYLQAEAVGDEGFTGNLELISPSLAPKWAGVFDDLRLFAFTDGGTVWVLQPLPEETSFLPLASAGVGLRLELLRHLKGDVALAVPFISGAATHAYTPRATFSLKSEF